MTAASKQVTALKLRDEHDTGGGGASKRGLSFELQDQYDSQESGALRSQQWQPPSSLRVLCFRGIGAPMTPLTSLIARIFGGCRLFSIISEVFSYWTEQVSVSHFGPGRCWAGCGGGRGAQHFPAF